MKIQLFLQNLDVKLTLQHPNMKKEIRRQQYINTIKREIDILDERRKNSLVPFGNYEQTIYNIINSLNLNNERQQLLQVKYKEKSKEDEKRNVDNWNDHFDKLKET